MGRDSQVLNRDMCTLTPDLLSIQLKGNLRTIHICTYPHGGYVDLKGAYHHKDDESS